MLGSLSGPTMRSILLGLIVISVVSFGAGAITDSVALDQHTPIAEPDEGEGPGAGEAENGERPPQLGDNGDDIGIADLDFTNCIRPLNSWPGTLAYFGAVFLGVYLGKRRYGTGTTLLAGFGLAPFILAGYFLNTDCVDNLGEPEDGAIPTPDPGTELFAIPDIPPTVLAVLVGIVLVGALVVVVRATGDQDPIVDEDTPEEHDPDVQDLARAAKAAADRLEEHNVDVDNAVYRAWWEMTRLLDVPNPESATPGEFADEAVAIGMSREHVEELTTLFEEVRYGNRDVSTREEHAIEVFRMIESEYGKDLDSPFEEGEEQ